MNAVLGQEPHRKRRRPALSCIQCRQRKVKCDRVTPCGPCVKYGTEQSCSYRGLCRSSSPNASRRAQSEHSEEPNDDSDIVNNDSSSLLQHAQALNHHHASQALSYMPRNTPAGNGTEASSSGSGGDSTEVSLSSVLEKLDALQARLNTLEDRGHSAHLAADLKPLHRHLDLIGSRIEELFKKPTTDNPKVVDDYKPPELTAPAPRACLTETSEKVKFWSPSHYLHSVKTQFELFGTLKSKPTSGAGDNIHDIKALVESCRSLRTNIRAQNRVLCQDLFPELQVPPRQICDQLVDRYFATMEMAYRILHRQTFKAEYEQYWVSPKDAPPHVQYKVLLVVAIGSIFVPSTPDIQSIRGQVSTWCYAAQWWLTGPSERSAFTYDGLQVRCLLSLSRRVNGLAKGQKEWISEGSLLRMAYAMGLHCRPSNFYTASPYHQELRSRLWVTILELSLESSADAALPPPRELEVADFQIPGNFNDEDFDKTSRCLPTPKDDSIFTESSIARQLFSSFRSRLEAAIATNQHGQQSYDKALCISSQLRKHCLAQQRFFGAHSQTVFHWTQCPDFHQKLLTTICNRHIILLQRPFISKAKTDPRFSFSREISLESAVGLLSQVGLLDGTSPNDFDRLTLHSVGTFKAAISIDVIATACIAVIQQLEDTSMAPFSGGIEGVLSRMGKAYRDPILTLLGHIQEQLLAMIAQGDASMKRYVLLTTALGHIRALEAGCSAENGMKHAILEGLEKCRNLLQGHVSSPLDMLMPPDMDQMFDTFDMGLDRHDLFWLWNNEILGI